MHILADSNWDPFEPFGVGTRVHQRVGVRAAANARDVFVRRTRP